MKILLDTHALLWFAESSNNLSEMALLVLNNPENDLLLSIASIWEMQIKISIGKLRIDAPLPEIITYQRNINNVQILPIELEHIWQLKNLPLHHRDPFDRMLIAQAMTEKIPILSIDSIFQNYSVNVIW